MATSAASAATLRSDRPIAMLSLDGGGVRGLSALLILRSLLNLVTEKLKANAILPKDHRTVRPQEVFDIGTGTSTGGLIVLMMVNLDLSIDQCIQQYKKLSKRIFSKQRRLLKRIFGSDWSKYSGKRLQEAVEGLLESEGQLMTLMMQSVVRENGMKGAVLCHEIQQKQAIFFCSERCKGPYEQHMLQCDLQLRHAARATSAAPSYFKEMKIQERFFVDGGYGETNNPSWESRLHFRQNHAGTTDRQIVLINIGTGTVPANIDQERLQKPSMLSKILPKGLVKALGLIEDFVRMATESEVPARQLANIAEEHPEDLFFRRFSANTGVHAIKLDDWRAVSGVEGVGIIESQTQKYLDDEAVVAELKEAAKELAKVYTRRHEQPEELSESVLKERQDADVLATTVVGQERSIRGVPIQHNESRVLEHPFETIPSLVTGTEPTQSPSPSPPRTPEPGRARLPPILTGDNKEVLRGQGDQFEQVFLPSPLLPSSASTSRSPSRKPKRAQTYPPKSAPVEDG